jgi:uncharacterized protein involved in exopolysaccharide biosynthesis
MTQDTRAASANPELDLRVILSEVRRGLAWLIGLPIVLGALGVAISFAITPTFTSQTTFIPPQQTQSSAMSALASLGPLSGLVGGAAGIKSPAEQYISLLQSVTVADRMIDEFKLREVYDEKFRVDARKVFASNVRISMGRKDGLITVAVDDEDPARAAEMANRHVDALRDLTSKLALSEAQLRRVFFEGQMKQTREQLEKAQLDLQSSGFSAGALKAEPRASADIYARLRAEVTAAEARLQALRRSLADTAPEVQQALAALGTLRGQLMRAEAGADGGGADADYVSRYREFKYQETLFELFARQYEMARVDESREGTLIQVVDRAMPAEKKSQPRRSRFLLGGLLVGLLAAAGIVAFRVLMRPAASQRGPADRG